ncbi:glutamate receptor 2.7-like [Actinidia eriantha]|uniref:glutamate receptor 2.7-like n=1 Tax=Actinidia eriantha TaxID=165200 RepID=UPI00258486D1|nr:glutamate receptor 2.7-like [Actinidia eriantha]
MISCLNLSLCLLLLSLRTISCTSQTSSSMNGTVFFQVGVVLDLDSLVGQVGLSCLSMALSDFYSIHSNFTTRLVIHVRDSKGQVIDAAASAVDLLKDVEVDAIVGPQKSAQASFLTDLGERARVPIISFSATSPSILSRSTYFVQTALSDDAQVGSIAAIIKAFQWREVVVINEDTDFGNGVIPYLSNAFQDIDARIAYRSIIPLSASDDLILRELYKMMTMQTRVFVVHMSHALGSRLFLKAKESGMLSKGYVWIITDGLMDLIYSMDSHVIDAMQGVLGVKPRIPGSKELDSFTVRWKRKFLQDNPTTKQVEMSIFGLWAYDTMWALAMAAEKVGSREPITPENSSTKLFGFGISQTGPKLLKALLNTRFEGLSGEFYLVNGQLHPSPFQILNVVGKGEREIGIWTQSHGISRELNGNATYSSSASKDKVRGIIWPGESTIVPKGWEFPVSGKKLKIGVPVKHGFTEFVKVEKDPHTNNTKVSGFCIDIFDSVMKALPYAVPYEYVPFEKTDGLSAGNYYNELIHQVRLQKYDAAVGDITITANRSSSVDFTLPYADGGVSMIVPVTYEDSNSKWTFLKPLKEELWLTSIAFFILTGFTIWVLEHRINTAFRGPPSQHFGMILWLPFSTLVFAHRERLISNLARLVMAVWLFVVLILSSSYTASLSSRLTVQRLRPTVTDVKELIKNGDYVGYQYGSFIFDILKGMGFEESKLKPQKSREDCDEAMSNGGVFLSKYCGQYTAVGPIYRTDGFGFVFPKGSPLVSEISRAVISMTEGDKILEMERMWFGKDSCTLKEMDSITSSSLTLQSFQGLFAITGCVTVLCLLVYVAQYIYENRDILKRISDSSTTTWSRLCALCRHFDQRDLSSYPFSRKRGTPDRVLELNDAGDSSLFSDTPSLPRNSHSDGIVSTSSEDGMEDSIEAVDPNSLDMVVVHLQE